MLRAAQAGDGAAVAAIANHYIRETTISFSEVEKTPDEVAAQIAARPGFFVAEAAGRVVGFASYGPFRAGSGYRETCEHTVLLAPEACGGGLGRALMAALEAHARGAGVHSLIGGISAENTGGLAFHARLGFAEVGRIPEAGLKAGRRIDLVLMQKRLSLQSVTD